MVRKVARHTPSSYVNKISPAQPSLSVENNFIGGLKTEFTGLNFPSNACTDVDNCVFSIFGDVTRRGGFNFEKPTHETNQLSSIYPIGASDIAQTTYRWRNVNGDGDIEVLVRQIGNWLIFYESSYAGVQNTGVSNQLVTNVTMPIGIDLRSFQTTGSTPQNFTCQFADGNGVLFVFNPDCEPFFVTWNNGDGVNATSSTATAQSIKINIRDLVGVSDNLGVQGDPTLLSVRPATLDPYHHYNLLNQGWSDAATFPWVATSNQAQGQIIFLNEYTLNAGNHTFLDVGTITPAPAPGQAVLCTVNAIVQVDVGVFVPVAYTQSGTVISYIPGTLVVDLPGITIPVISPDVVTSEHWTFFQIAPTGSLITIWFNEIGNYPSNADIWWQYKDTSGVFNPSISSILDVALPNTQAPPGHFILNAFNQNRTGVSGIAGLNSSLVNVSTTARPHTGAWFAGRVWYSGVDDFLPANTSGGLGINTQTSWSENIYYSQVITQGTSSFGNCYSINDPTNETFFDPLPTDGGVITIPGTGRIHKLFPLLNGLLVMADNGIWLIAGSAGYGFDSTSYVVSKISSVRVMSALSVVDVLGYPYFWNLEGIYKVEAGKEQTPYGHGGLQVVPITVGTIRTFYSQIPADSKRYAQGSYDPINYTLQWVYRSTQESSNLTDRYFYDSALSLSTLIQAFYPYSIGNPGGGSPVYISGVVWMDYPSGILTPQFKYPITLAGGAITLIPSFRSLWESLISTGVQETQANFDLGLRQNTSQSGALADVSAYGFDFAEENDFTAWKDWEGVVPVDYTSFFITGYKLDGQGFRKWQPIYVNTYSRNSVPNRFIIQGLFDYTLTAVGRTSLPQTVINNNTNYSNLFRRHKLRGHGKSFQMKITSVSGQPFDLIGWSVPEQGAIGS